MRLVAIMLESTDVEHHHHSRKFLSGLDGLLFAFFFLEFPCFFYNPPDVGKILKDNAV